MSDIQVTSCRVTGTYAANEPAIEDAEDCSIHVNLAETLGRTPGEQIRLWPINHPERGSAYTIQTRHHTEYGAEDTRVGNETVEHGDEIVLAQSELDRIAGGESFVAQVTAVVPQQVSYTEAWKRDGICEIVWDTGQRQLLVCAPHAGDIEANTGRIAGAVRKRLGAKRASAWSIHGFGRDAFDRWHITTNDMNPVSYPGLNDLSDRGFQAAVSLHIWTGDEVLVGGLAPRDQRITLANQIQTAIDDTRPVVVDHTEGKYMATTEDNVVNWITADQRSGIQVEFPPFVVNRYWGRLSKAIATVYEQWLSAPSED